MSSKDRPSRILVVDDDASTVSALTLLLEFDGYRVVGCTTAEEAIRYIEAEPFDAVITDLTLNGAQGVEVVQAAATRPETLILVVSGSAGTASAARAVMLGAHRVFSKPLAFDEFEAELARLVKGEMAVASPESK